MLLTIPSKETDPFLIRSTFLGNLGALAMDRIWTLLKDTGEGFVSDDALTRAAGSAYFTLFAVGPLLFIATGIASLVFGRDQVDDAIAAQMTGMLGDQAAD